MLKFLMETKSGRKGVKNFNDIYEYIDFMTKNGNKIKFIKESEMPYTDKPVKLPSVSSSDGWKQIDASAFGDIDSDGEKGDCLLPSDTQSVFKNDVKFEPSKSSESTDKADEPKIENSPVKTNNDGEEQDMPKFNYEDSDSKEEKNDKSEEKEENINEGFKDKLKKGIATAGVAASLATGNANAYDLNDMYYDGAHNPEDAMQIVDSNSEKPMIKSVKPDGTIIDQYGNEYSKEEFDAMLKGENPFRDGARNPNTESEYDDEIAETLRIAGVQLNEAEDDILELDEYDDDETDESEYDNVDSSLIDKIANDPHVYNQGRDENDDGQEPDAEKIINSIDYIINNYGLSGRQALKAYSKATFMDYDMVKDAWESDGSAWDENDMPKTEDVNNPNDGDVDEKTGKEKLMEEEPLEEEIGPSRLWKYQEHPEMNFAILSADRSERTPEENKAKSEELKKDIKSMGYWYTELKGGYVEISENGKRVPVDGEDSFIVPNMTKKEAMELGKKYDQDTVMFKDAKAHTLQYIITNERAGNVGDADSSFETQAGKDNFSVSSGNDLDYYSRLPKSNKKDLKIGFNWKE